MAPTKWLPMQSAVLLACVFGIVYDTTAATTSPLRLLEEVYISSANDDFRGHRAAFDDAIAWHRERLHQRESSGSYVACADYGDGLQARSSLEKLLTPSAVRLLSNHKEYGACFIATASPTQAATLSERPISYRLTLFFPLPSVLKLAPGLLDHGHDEKSGIMSERLQTTYGKRVEITNNVHGLSLALSPGLLPAHDVSNSADFIASLQESLMSRSVDLHAANFWSDPDMVDSHQARPEGSLRAREWIRAAHVVHQLSSIEGPSPGDICSWGNLLVHHVDDDHVVITGLGHLLPGGRGAGGRKGEEADELKIACFMGLVSHLASTPEVLRVSPLHRAKILNAVASSVMQAGTINTAEKPLTAAGLDGTGEVIQIVDTGLDETSCFFVDESGEQIEHGYYFDEVGFVGEVSDENARVVFNGGHFPFDTSRRKIVQYTRLVAPDDPGDSPYFSTTDGGQYTWYSSYGFGMDMEAGHGTHTAGSAAGATLNDPAETVICSGTDELGCIGGCLNTSYVETLLSSTFHLADFPTWCPQFDCDGYGEDYEFCLSEDISTTLTENGGMAQGAKLSIFDTSLDGSAIWGSLAGKGMWTSTEGTGCLLHSNSWGADQYCTVDQEAILNDEYMYDNPDHLLIFAAGNDGDSEGDPERKDACTMNSPGTGKNVLTVGASSSSSSRLTYTNNNGEIFDGETFADIDTVAFFSSRGFTSDYRVKPEVVVPGDQVLSASSDGTDEHSCQLVGTSGTSMSTPVVAGAAAMIRQYFTDPAFYEADVNARGLCAIPTAANTTTSFLCDAFSPYASTIKAMLINSADLMGGSSEPDGSRGFGRVHLETVLPLDAAGNRALFVVDAADRRIPERKIVEFYFVLEEDTDLELRATLAWLDPPATQESSVQLLNDLDLTVVSPSGVQYRMWQSGADNRNVVERVIINAVDIDKDNDGEWKVAVSSAALTTASQAYSLVVTGPLAEGSGNETMRNGSRALSPGGVARVLTVLSTVAVAVFAMWAGW